LGGEPAPPPRGAWSEAGARRATRRRPAAYRRLLRRASARLRRAPRARSFSESAAPLVRRQRLGELVEVSLQEPVELVDGQLDPVVGEPVLGEVVGADLLGPLAGS